MSDSRRAESDERMIAFQPRASACADTSARDATSAGAAASHVSFTSVIVRLCVVYHGPRSAMTSASESPPASEAPASTSVAPDTSITKEGDAGICWPDVRSSAGMTTEIVSGSEIE